ncbi:MAG: sporulation protein YjcZ [Bacilli bacterium]|nr:sporulation protein YjcZ [Bacilli bacterium]
MYYYGYSGGYGYNNPCCQSYPVYPQYGYGSGTGYGSAIILVLFILLVIVIGSRFFGN